MLVVKLSLMWTNNGVPMGRVGLQLTPKLRCWRLGMNLSPSSREGSCRTRPCPTFVFACCLSELVQAKTS